MFKFGLLGKVLTIIEIVNKETIKLVVCQDKVQPQKLLSPRAGKFLVYERRNFLLKLFPYSFALFKCQTDSQNWQILTSGEVVICNSSHFLILLHDFDPFFELFLVPWVFVRIVFQNFDIFGALLFLCQKLFPTVHEKHILALEILF